MRRPTWAALAIIAFISCESSAPGKVTGSGATNRPVGNIPYGLPTPTPIGGERPHLTPTWIPSNIPPTPSR